MLLVFTMAAVLWGIGWAMKMPIRARLILIGLLYVAVLAVHVILPDLHPLRQATGGSAAFWLILGGFAVLVWVYRQVLSRLRGRAVAVEAARDPVPKDASALGEGELTRYARHIVLREIGGMGQKRLKAARVLVIGAGGLGSPALQYLAAAGVGTIGVIDDDVVEAGNLQRQVVHTDDRIGMPKVFSAEAALKALNPYVVVRPYKRRLTEEMAPDLFSDYDIILDGTDNFDTRYLSNRVAVAQGKPLVSGALSQWEGQISVFHPAKGGPCYQCIFPQAPAAGLAPTCAEAGVLGPLPGVIGAMMAVETVKLILGSGQALRAEMLIYDALWGETRKITLKARVDCPVCKGRSNIPQA